MAFGSPASSGLHNPSHSQGKIAGILTNGTARDIQVKDGFAYLAAGDQGLQIVDCTTIDSPAAIASLPLSNEGQARKIFIQGNTAYLAHQWGGIQIVDISDPKSPEKLSAIDCLDSNNGFEVWDVSVNSDTIYVSAGWDENGTWNQGLLIFDASSQERLGTYSVAVDGSWIQGIAVSGGYAYLAAGGEYGVKVLDITDPGAPFLSATVATNGDARDVSVDGDQLYVADGWSGLAVIDISDPASPQQIAQKELNNFESTSVFAADGLAYLSDQNAGGFKCFDVHNPQALHIRTLAGGNSSFGVCASPDHVYLASGDSGLKIFDIGASVQPRQVGQVLTKQTRDMALSGDYAYVADGWNGFKIFDVSNPSNPVKTGEITDLNCEVLGVAVRDTYAYLGCHDQGFTVVDVQDPSAPALVTTLAETGYEYRDVLVDGDFAYVRGREESWGNDGLLIINISSPANPVHQGKLEIGSAFGGYDKAGDLMYLAAGNNGLRMIDVSDPATPAPAAGFGLDHWAQDVSVHGNFAYLANDWGGLRVFDISDPSQPMLCGEVPIQNSRAVTALGENLYLLSDEALHIFDITQQDAPILVGTLKGGFAWDDPKVLSSNGYVHLSGHDQGLRIIAPYPIPARENTPLSYQLPAGDSVYTSFTLGEKALSLGLSCSSNGTLDWSTPHNEQVGLHEILVTADTTSKTYHIWVENQNQPPSIAPAETLAWKHSMQNTCQLQVADPDLQAPGYQESFSYQLDVQSMQKGISINTQGVLGWKPNPVHIGNHSVNATITDTAGAQAQQTFSIRVFDFTQSMTQIDAGSPDVFSNARDVRVAGGYVYALGDEKLAILESTDLQTVVATVPALYGAMAIEILGDYAYIACDYDGLRIIDIADPENPVVILGQNDALGYTSQANVHYYNLALMEKNGAPFGCLVGEKNGNQLFELVDLSDPASPSQQSQSLSTNWDWPKAVRVAGDFAYVAFGWTGLVVYNIKDLSNIVMAGKLEEDLGQVNDLALDTGHAYLACAWDGLKVVDISEPTVPSLISSTSGNDAALLGVVQENGFVYLASQTGNGVALDIIDVDTPSSPKFLERLSLAGSSNKPMGLDFRDGFVYAALGSGGIKVFSPQTLIAEEGPSFSFEVPVIGGSEFTLDAASQGAGMTIDPTSGVVTWDEPSNDLGSSLYELSISYTDASQTAQELDYLLWVQNANQPPSITPPSETLAWQYGRTNTYQVQAEDQDLNLTGYNESFTYSLNASSLNKGISINDQGTLAWEPAAGDVGQYTVAVTVTDKAGAHVTQDIAIQVFDIKQEAAVVARITEMIENARVVKVQGDYAYVLDNNSLRIIDITDLNYPVKVGSALCDNPQDLALAGETAYLADSGEGLRIVDITSKSNPETIATFKSLSEGEWCEYLSIAVSGNFAYLAGEREEQRVMDVVDISDPSAPSLVQTESSYEVSNKNNDSFQAIAVSGGYAYLAQGWNGLTILDLSNLGAISKVGGMQFNDSVRDIEIDGSYAYLAADWGGLKILDISDPAGPQEIGQYQPQKSWAQGIALHGDRAYLVGQTDQAGRLDILDIAQPFAPNLVDTIFSDTDSFNQVDFANGCIFVAGGSGGVSVLSPEVIKAQEGTDFSFQVPVIGGTSFSIDPEAQAKGMSIDPNTGVVIWPSPANSDVGVHQVAISFTRAGTEMTTRYPILVQNSNQAPSLAAAGETLAWTLNLKNHFTLQVTDLDLSAPGYTEGFSYQVDSDSSAKGLSVDASGHLIWTPQDTDVGQHEVTVTVTDASGASAQQTFPIRVFDLSLTPIEAGHISQGLESVRAVKVHGNYAYILDSHRLLIFHVGDINEPELKGSVAFVQQDCPNCYLGDPKDLFVAGEYAYVVLDHGGLQIVDISSKSSPELLIAEDADGGSYYKTNPDSAYRCIVVAGDYAYLSGSLDTGGLWQPVLEIVNIGTPSQPSPSDLYTFSGNEPLALAYSMNTLFAACGWDGIRSFDVGDPQNIVPAGKMNTNQEAFDLALGPQGYAYLANAWGGLKVIDITDPKDFSFAGGLGTSSDFNARSVDIQGQTAYLAGNTPEGAVLSIIDISDPLSPKRKNSLTIDTDYPCNQVDFSRYYAFVGNAADGVRIISPESVTGLEGQPLSFELPILEPEAYTFSLDPISSNKGLGIDATGRITWDAPHNTQVGLHEVSALMSRNGTEYKRSYQLWVANVNQAPVFAGDMPEVLNWYSDVPNVFRLKVQDEDVHAPGYAESFVYQLETGSIAGASPPSIDHNGVLTWTPTETDYENAPSGGYPVSVTVTDAQGQTATHSLQLKLFEPDYEWPESNSYADAGAIQTNGTPVSAKLMQGLDASPETDWYTFSLDENQLLNLTLSTEGTADYQTTLLSAQEAIALQQYLSDEKGIISGTVDVQTPPQHSFSDILNAGQKPFLQVEHLYAVGEHELQVYTLNGETPALVGAQAYGAPSKEQQMTPQNTLLANKDFTCPIHNSGWNFWIYGNGTSPDDFDGWYSGQDGQFSFLWSLEDAKLKITVTGDLQAWSDDFTLQPGDVLSYTIHGFDHGPPAELWLTNGNKEVFHLLGNTGSNDADAFAFEAASAELKSNLVYLHKTYYDELQDKECGLKGALDVSDPAAPKWLGLFKEYEPRDIWDAYHDTLYAGSSDPDLSDVLAVYSISSQGIQQQTTLADFHSQTEFSSLKAGGKTLLAYAHNWNNPHRVDDWGDPIGQCLFVYDLTQPENPELLNILPAIQPYNFQAVTALTKTHALLRSNDQLSVFKLSDLRSGSAFGPGKIEPVSVFSGSAYDFSSIRISGDFLYLPLKTQGLSSFQILHLQDTGRLRPLNLVEDKGTWIAGAADAPEFLTAAGQDGSGPYRLYALTLPEANWIYEQFPVPSGKQALNTTDPIEAEETSSLGYAGISVGLEPGDYYITVQNAGDYVSTQGYALRCALAGTFTQNPETLPIQLSDQGTVSVETLYSLLDSTAYSFSTDQDQQLFLDFKNPSFVSDYSLTLVNAQDYWAQESFQLGAGQDLSTGFNLSQGDYSLILENRTVVDALNEYTLELAGLDLDPEGELEPNDAAPQANPLGVGQTISGRIAQDQDQDFYCLRLDHSVALDIVFSTLNAFSEGRYTLDLILGGEIIDTISLATGLQETVPMGLFPGRYLLRVSGTGVDSKDAYVLQTLAVEDADREFEPNNAKHFANVITGYLPKGGRLYGDADEDWYAFHFAEPGLFKLYATGAATAEETFQVQVFNIGGTPVMDFSMAGNAGISQKMNLYAGDYALRISGEDIENGEYSLEVQGAVSELKELIALNIEAEEPTPVLENNEQLQLISLASYSDGSVLDVTELAQWKTRNADLAIVDKGLVTGTAGGAATITASYGDEATKTKTDSYTINIKDPAIETAQLKQTYGNLILVAGGGVAPSNKLAPTTQSLCDYVYLKFKDRGFEDEDMYYFNPKEYKDLDGNGFDDQIVDQPQVSTDTFLKAISDWAEPFPTNGPLYLYLNDHGAADTFQLAPGELLTAAALSAQLTAFEQTTTRKTIVIIEACHSGSFLDNLQAENRLIITSADEGLSYLGENGAASFSMFFFDSLYKGSSLQSAFDDATLSLLDLGKPYSMMNPQYSDLSNQFENHYLVGNFALAPMFAHITAIEVPEEYTVGSEDLQIAATVTGAAGGSVWATIKPKDYEPPPTVGTFAAPELQLPSVEMLDEQNQQFDHVYTGSYSGLKVNGVYEVVIFARDGQGNVSKSLIQEVSVSGGSDNQPPQASFAYFPELPGTYQSVSFEDASVDPDGSVTGWDWDFGDGTSSSEQNPLHSYTDPGSYTVTLSVFDESGATHSTAAILEIGADGQDVPSLNIHSGWNLLSAAVDIDPAQSLSDASRVISVWAWTGSTWSLYLPGEESPGAYAQAKGFEELSLIQPGQGFWINAGAPLVQVLPGIPQDLEPPLSSGWNLIGAGTGSSQSVTDFLQGLDLSVASLWKWNNSNWSVCLPGEDDLGAAYAQTKGFGTMQTIEPGIGFWVNCQ